MSYIKRALLGSVVAYAAEDEKGAAAPDAADKGVINVEDIPDAGGLQNAANAEGADAADGADDKAAAAEDDKKPKPQLWQDKEIARKHRQLKEREDEIALLKRRNAELEAKAGTAPAVAADDGEPGGGTGGAPAQRRGESDADFEARVQAEASKRVAQTLYQRDMQEIDAKGKKDYGDGFGEALVRLDQLGGFDEVTMQAIRATDDPARVIFEMGSKPENYQRIMEIADPMKRALAIYEMAKAPKPKAKVSEAPSPVDPIGSGAGAGNKVQLRDDMPDEAWYAQRQKEKRASQGRPWSTQR